MCLLISSLVMSNEASLLIDDFSTADGHSALGTSWQGFTDRVMGGLSDMQAGYRQVDGQTVLALSGQVRLENNGGFIQVRLPLEPRGRDFDASGFQSIRIEARALRPGSYYLHLRTADTKRPWSYYRAGLDLSAEWATIELPFAAFEGRSLVRPLDTARLRSVALVAYGEAFEADVELQRIELVAD